MLGSKKKKSPNCLLFSPLFLSKGKENAIDRVEEDYEIDLMLNTTAFMKVLLFWLEKNISEKK